MGEFKRQHTVTKGYLRGFCADSSPNTLWSYSKGDGASERSNIDKATVKFYAYSFRDSDGEWNHEVEKLLGRIESVALPLLKKVISNDQLTLTERTDFALFVGTILRRPAALLEQFENVMRQHAADAQQQLQFLESELPKILEHYPPEEVEKTRERIRNGTAQFSFDAAKRAAMDVWVNAMPTYTRIIADMHWQLWKADKGLNFITSDAPAFVRRETCDSDPSVVGVGKADLKAELAFPLSKKVLFLAKHERCKPVQIAKKSRVKELNGLVVRMAFKNIFAHEESDDIRNLVLRNIHFSPPLPDLSAVFK